MPATPLQANAEITAPSPSDLVSVTFSAPLTVNLAANPLPTGGTPPYTYAWDFGDGSTGTGASVTHDYATAGSYAAVLTVTDSVGTKTTVPIPVVIQGVAPPPLSASATASPVAGPVPLPVAFDGSASGGTPPYTYAWDFGDGSTGSGQTASHTYAVAGNYTAVLTVTDAGNPAQVATAKLTVAASSGGTLKLSVSASPTSGKAPLKVKLAVTVSSGTGPYTPDWSFGDGTGVNDKWTPSHTYQSSGTYSAVVTVTDSKGNTGRGSVTISVS